MDRVAIEAVLRRDRAVVLCALTVVTVLAWTYVLWLASTMTGQDMPDMDMQGMEMSGMMAPELRAWGLAEFAVMFAMWAVMMTGMMLPSVAPTLLTYVVVARKGSEQGKPFAPVAYFAGGYLIAWTVFALAATMVQWALESMLALSAMAGLGGPLGGIALMAAGVYQWTPLKQTCLSACQSPLLFIMRHGGFRRDAMGSIRLGVRHGLYCVGCCWALMAILFVFGVMNVLWIAGLAIFVLAEKVVPKSRAVSRAAGILLILAGGLMLA